jgi:hypothetical protein
MTIYEIMQENQQKFKFSKNGNLYLNTFEKREEPKNAKLKNKPFALWKTEDAKRIAKKAKDEMNKARVHGNPNNANYEMQDGVLHFVPGKPKVKVEEVVKEEDIA